MRRGLQTNPDIDRMTQQGCKVLQQRCSCCTFDRVQIKLEDVSSENALCDTRKNTAIQPDDELPRNISKRNPSSTSLLFTAFHEAFSKMHTQTPLHQPPVTSQRAHAWPAGVAQFQSTTKHLDRGPTKQGERRPAFQC